MTNALQETQLLGQSIWYDNISCGLIVSGELEKLIEMGVTGVTSNPTIFEKAVGGSSAYDEALIAQLRENRPAIETYEALAIEDIRAAADLLSGVYEESAARDGYVSLEVSPSLAHDTERTVSQAVRLFQTLERPNVMIKVPATPEGIPAVKSLIGQGVNVNVTLIFALEAYRKVMEAYISGLEDLFDRGGDLTRIASVASFFVSRVDTAVDGLLEEKTKDERRALSKLLGKAAVSNAKLAYQAFKETFGGGRFSQLKAKGARVQRPLWASTGAKNSKYSDVLYVESLIGPDTVNTMPPNTLTAFLEHGVVEPTLERDISDAREAIEALESAGISMREVTDRLLADGVRAFADSFEKLLANIEDKKERLATKGSRPAGTALGEYAKQVEASLSDLRRNKVVERLWQKDHTLWAPEPREIVDRLGWLTVADDVGWQIEGLQSFARDIVNAGFKHVVLLGMGGSSLGPEVLRQTFTSAQGYPGLFVLDSTIPDRIRSVSQSIDPASSLFLISSKSGTTIEPLALYKYFRGLVEESVGKQQAGRHFVAITDPGTPLEEMAAADDFRRVFSNSPDVGGRYSVLSYFGMVPAALMGVNVAELLGRARRMAEACRPGVSIHENPGLWLGTVAGTLANSGRDKLTLMTSPSIGAFGLWAEQLIAESTGKSGKGIVPIAGEPLMTPDSYGADRLFVYMRLAEDDNIAVDETVAALRSKGHPLVELDLKDRMDLGGEFFRWEFATAIAGSIVGIHPFDQPNVQQAKDNTNRILTDYKRSGKLPEIEASTSLDSLLSRAAPGKYLAIMAYLNPTAEIDEAFTQLRRVLSERYGIPTTLGYGPRLLHSTGQMHKGGPDSGLFLQITADGEAAIQVPGEAYDFGVLASAQALGDLAALQEIGREVAKIHLRSADGSELLSIVSGLG